MMKKAWMLAATLLAALATAPLTRRKATSAER